MYRIATIFLFMLLYSWKLNAQTSNEVVVSVEEMKLYRIMMEYRKEKGLETIPLSKSLTKVAQIHATDLGDNAPDRSEKCNAHSWSDNGNWTGCCYTPDHVKAKCMWNKPKELTSYSGYGFEIAVGSSHLQFQDFVMTPEYALDSWKQSYHHNYVIVNHSPWEETVWKAIGIGIYKGFATVWFGEEEDKDGGPLISNGK